MHADNLIKLAHFELVPYFVIGFDIFIKIQFKQKNTLTLFGFNFFLNHVSTSFRRYFCEFSIFFKQFSALTFLYTKRVYHAYNCMPRVESIKLATIIRAKMGCLSALLGLELNYDFYQLQSHKRFF